MDASQLLSNKQLSAPVIAAGTATANPSVPLGVATKQYVDANASPFSTGDVKLTFQTVAPAGWVLMNDLSIGDAASGATGRANADTVNLFTLLWNNIIDTWAPVSGGRGVSAAADYAADKTLTLPKTLGRALACFGTGAGLTARALGENLGEQAHVQIESELAAHTHLQAANTQLDSGGGMLLGSNAGDANDFVGGTTQSAGSGAAMNVMQPTSFLNVIVRL